MISAAQLVNGIWMGTVLIALALLPSLLENSSDALRRFGGAFLQIARPYRWRERVHYWTRRQQPWLAALGAALIAASLLLYFAH